MSDAVLIDLFARHAPGTDVVFLDTGYHFTETIGMRDAVAATYRGRLNTITAEPEQTVAEQDAEARDLFASNPDRCCFAQGRCPSTVPCPATTPGARLRRDGTLVLPVPHFGGGLGQAQRQGQGQLKGLAGRRPTSTATSSGHEILTNPLLDDGFTLRYCFLHLPHHRRGRPRWPLGRRDKSRGGIHVVCPEHAVLP